LTLTTGDSEMNIEEVTDKRYNFYPLLMNYFSEILTKFNNRKGLKCKGNLFLNDFQLRIDFG